MFPTKKLQEVDIFDIDGTLSYVFGDIPDTTGFSTYAYWSLISENFTKDKESLKKMIDKWEESMKTEKDPTTSSHDMMQKSINTYKENITSKDVRAYAKELTTKFIKHGAIRKNAIKHLESRIQQGITCVLSTGSYQDGALGFVDSLIENNLLCKNAHEFIYISGAIVDWEKRILLHANVRDRKLIGLMGILKKPLNTIKLLVNNVYADDPWINDRDILALAPRNGAHIIRTIKNKDKSLPEGYSFSTWNVILELFKKTKSDTLLKLFN